MLRCMNSGISGMKVNQTKLDVIGNNIANVSTTAFKSGRTEFKDMLYQNSGTPSSPTSVTGGRNGMQVGLGVQLSTINKVMTDGHTLTTNKYTDVAIQNGEGYFIVGKGVVDYNGDGNKINDTTQGFDVNTNGDEGSGAGVMSILYTRDGNFGVDHEGNLVTADGRRVMGYLLKTESSENNSITPGVEATDDTPATSGTVHFVDANDSSLAAVDGKGLQPMMMPLKIQKGSSDTDMVAVKSYEIGANGVIKAILDDGSISAVGQIAMAKFSNPEGLTAVGGNLLQVSSNSGREVIKTPIGTAADKDNSKSFGDMVQGALEGSNVDLTEQFTDMIVATRAFQASSKIITTGDEVLQTITNLIR